MSKSPYKEGKRSARNFYGGPNPYTWELHRQQWDEGFQEESAAMLQEERLQQIHNSRTPADIIDEEPNLSYELKQLLKQLCEKMGLE